MTSLHPNYIPISENSPLPEIVQFRHFRAIVVVDAPYRDEWQDEVSRWLVDAGCLYMMAWGLNCSSWDDSVDYAQIQKYLPGDAPEEEFVMTTWHDDETLESVFWFAQFNAHDPYDLITNTLIVHVGTADRGTEFLTLFEHSYTLAERELEPEIDPKTGQGWFRRLFSA